MSGDGALGLGSFPGTRMRRNRADAWTRRLVAENRLSVDDLIWPVFALDGENRVEDVPSMPGVERLSVDRLVDAVGRAADLGIPAIALFPYTDPAVKTPDAREATNPDNLVCRAVRAIRAAHPDMGVVCDVALDPFNSDGHDGLVRDGEILNDETVEILCRQAVVQADAGMLERVLDNLVDEVRRWDKTGYKFLKRVAARHSGRWEDILDSRSIVASIQRSE